MGVKHSVVHVNKNFRFLRPDQVDWEFARPDDFFTIIRTFYIQ